MSYFTDYEWETFGEVLWPVTITVTRDGAPLVGAKVYFFTTTGEEQCPNTGLLQAWIRATDEAGMGSTQLYNGTYDVGILHTNLDPGACQYDWYGVGYITVMAETDFLVEVVSSVPSDPLPEEPLPEEPPVEEPAPPPEEPPPSDEYVPTPDEPDYGEPASPCGVGYEWDPITAQCVPIQGISPTFLIGGGVILILALMAMSKK